MRPLPGRDDAFIVEPAFHVDLPRLIQASRERWRQRGQLIERAATAAELAGGDLPTIACLGAGEVALGRLPLERSKGELLHLEPTLDANAAASSDERDEVRNDGHWLLPLADGSWVVGATYDRVAVEASPSLASSSLLLESARRLLRGREPRVRMALAGWRTSARDLRPVAGWLPGQPFAGVCNGLGSKGALLGPWLARQWAEHLIEGRPFDPAVTPGRPFAQL